MVVTSGSICLSRDLKSLQRHSSGSHVDVLHAPKRCLDPSWYLCEYQCLINQRLPIHCRCWGWDIHRAIAGKTWGSSWSPRAQWRPWSNRGREDFPEKKKASAYFNPRSHLAYCILDIAKSFSALIQLKFPSIEHGPLPALCISGEPYGRYLSETSQTVFCPNSGIDVIFQTELTWKWWEAPLKRGCNFIAIQHRVSESWLGDYCDGQVLKYRYRLFLVLENAHVSGGSNNLFTPLLPPPELWGIALFVIFPESVRGFGDVELIAIKDPSGLRCRFGYELN